MDGRIPLCPKNNCDFICCTFNQGNYIVLYPGELEQAIQEEYHHRHLDIFDDNYHGGKKAICNAHETATCDHGYKPLDCKTYPLFPMLNIKNSVANFIKGSKCPVNIQEISYHREWAKIAWENLAKNNLEVAEWLRKVSLVGYEKIDEQSNG